MLTHRPSVNEQTAPVGSRNLLIVANLGCGLDQGDFEGLLDQYIEPTAVWVEKRGLCAAFRIIGESHWTYIGGVDGQPGQDVPVLIGKGCIEM